MEAYGIPIIMLLTVLNSNNNWLRDSIIGTKILNMLEFRSHSIACDIPGSQVLWNASSQVCSIAACGLAFMLPLKLSFGRYLQVLLQLHGFRSVLHLVVVVVIF